MLMLENEVTKSKVDGAKRKDQRIDHGVDETDGQDKSMKGIKVKVGKGPGIPVVLKSSRARREPSGGGDGGDNDRDGKLHKFKAVDTTREDDIGYEKGGATRDDCGERGDNIGGRSDKADKVLDEGATNEECEK